MSIRFFLLLFGCLFCGCTHHSLGSAELRLSFHEGMSGSILYSRRKASSSPEWQLLKKSYDQFRPFLRLEKKSKKRDRKTASILIPKIIHIVWLSEEPISNDIQSIINTWKKFHPKWQLKIWKKEDVDFLLMNRRDVYERAIDIQEKTYIARYEILYRFGGVSIEPQLECLKEFDQLHILSSFYAAAWELQSAGISTAIIGASPRHPVIIECLQTLTPGPQDSNFLRIYNTVGPKQISQSLFKTLEQHPQLLQRMLILPLDIASPWPSWKRLMSVQEARQTWIKKHSYTFYHWDKAE